MLKDKDVRPLALALATNQNPGARVLPEVGIIQGNVFMDVAALSVTCLHGYEVKSEADTLKRLPRQVDAYSRVLDRCTLVVDSKHFCKASPLLPEWWGIVRVWRLGNTVAMEQEREAKPNPAPDTEAVARLLWRNEVLAILESIGATRGVRSAPKNALYRRLLEVQAPDVLRQRVRQVVCERTTWRPA